MDTWIDQSINATILSGESSPLYVINSINFNPAVVYNGGARHIMDAATAPTIGNTTVFLAGRPHTSYSSDGYNTPWNDNTSNEWSLVIYNNSL